MARAISALRLVHPFPSFLNSTLVFALALIAGGDTARATLLAAGMLGMQFCVGTVNDVFDESVDRAAKPWKPIAAGIITRRAASIVALLAGGGGFVLAAAGGVPLALMWVAMLACGLLYDARLKRTAWAWLCFSVAFAILPVYAWYGAVGTLPPRSEFLVPLAALAGPLIQLSNALADLEADVASGVPTLATRLGRRGSLTAMAALLVCVYGLAWLTLRGATTLVPIAGATALAVVGLGLSAARRPTLRQVGWTLQAVAIALLGLAWLSVVSARSA